MIRARQVLYALLSSQINSHNLLSFFCFDSGVLQERIRGEQAEPL